MFLSPGSPTFSSVPTSAIAPMTIKYSEKGVTSTSIGFRTNDRHYQTLTGHPKVPDFRRIYGNPADARDYNPYISVTIWNFTGYLTTSMDSAGWSLEATCASSWYSGFFEWATTEWENKNIIWLNSNCKDKFSDETSASQPEISATECYYLQRPNAADDTSFFDYPYTASAPCCSTCSIFVGDVQVYHWPISTAAPSVTELVNSEGFTFTYPSVYVAFQSLLASDLCGVIGPAMTKFTTMGFDATELSTAPSFIQHDSDYSGVDFAAWMTEQSWYSYTEIDFHTSVVCTNLTSSIWMADGFGGITTRPATYVILMTQFEDFGTYIPTSVALTITARPLIATWNPCTPFLSVPARVLTLDPRWNTCVPNMVGLHDPPILLTPANGFSPVTTTPTAAQDPVKTKNPVAPQGVSLSVATRTSPLGAKSAPSSVDDPVRPSETKFPSKLPATFTFGGTTYTRNSASNFLIGTQILAPSGNITASGTVLSMASDGGAVFLGSTETQILDPSYSIGTHTLSAGGPIVTVSGVAISVESNGESVVIGGSVTENISELLSGALWTKTTINSGGDAASLAKSQTTGRRMTSGSTSSQLGGNFWLTWRIVLYTTFRVIALLI